MAIAMKVVSVMSSVVMLMLALAPLCRFKAVSYEKNVLRTVLLIKAILYASICSGLSVVLAFVRQQGLYSPVEAVPPKPSSLSLRHTIACPKDSPSRCLLICPEDCPGDSALVCR